jgi:hypothetical protein
MTITPEEEPIILNADPEHTGLRVTVVLILVAAVWLLFFLLRALLIAMAPQLGAPSILSCLGALPLALLIAAASEALLKRTWTSGRRLVLDGHELRLQLPDAEEVVLDVRQQVNQTWWHFPLIGYRRGGRERRVPDRWHCVAGQLQQEGNRIVVFTFVSPSRLATWQADYSFYGLNPAEVYDTTLRTRFEGPVRPELPTAVIAGESGRYWLAERHRWQQGVELTPADFEVLLARMRGPATADPYRPREGDSFREEQNV